MENIIACLNTNEWITLMTLLLVFGLMMLTKLPADFVFLGGVTILYVTGVLNASEAMSGFSDSSVVVIAVLFMVIAGLISTGVLKYIAHHVLGIPRSSQFAIVRLMLVGSALSAILSNTAVVAMCSRIVTIWCKKVKIAPSKLLIPLSYASGMGGVCTLIGTPPNMIVSGFYQKNTGEAMNMFVTFPIGVICLFVGIGVMLLLIRFLPTREVAQSIIEIEKEEKEVRINRKTIISSFITIAMLVLSSLNVLSLLQSALLAAFAMFFTRCCSIEEARKSIDWEVLMVFAGSVVLGTAIQKSGLAMRIAKQVLDLCNGNPYMTLVALYAVVTILTEFVSNTATAAVFCPIAYNVAVTLGVNPLTFLITLMVASSSAFMTPIGSPTHIIIYGYGVYRFVDFMKVGVIMNIVIMGVTLLIVPLLFPF